MNSFFLIALVPAALLGTAYGMSVTASATGVHAVGNVTDSHPTELQIDSSKPGTTGWD
jgi:hypothetical protein